MLENWAWLDYDVFRLKGHSHPLQMRVCVWVPAYVGTATIPNWLPAFLLEFGFAFYPDVLAMYLFRLRTVALPSNYCNMPGI